MYAKPKQKSSGVGLFTLSHPHKSPTSVCGCKGTTFFLNTQILFHRQTFYFIPLLLSQSANALGKRRDVAPARPPKKPLGFLVLYMCMLCNSPALCNGWRKSGGLSLSPACWQAGEI